MSIIDIALIVGFLLSFLMAIALGGNDAASPTANVVGARVLTIKQAVIIFAIFALIGALTQGFMNMKTVGRGIVPSIDLLGAIIIVVSAFTWIMFCNNCGFEISVTHSIVGSILGYGLAAYGMGGIRWSLIQKVVLSFFASPLLSALIAFFMHKFLSVMTTKYDALNKAMSSLLKLALCYSAYAFGANDIANATGVYVTVAMKVLGHQPEFTVMFLLAAFGSIGVIIGGLLLGPRVIETVAFKIIKLSVISGTAAEITNAVVIHLFVTLPYFIIGYGLPVSTSLANIGALIGVGISSYGISGFNRRTVLILLMSWVATFFVTAILTYVVYSILFPYIGPIL